MNASVLYREQKDQPNRKPLFDYSAVVLRPVQGIWMLNEITDAYNTKYDKMQLKFSFIKLVAGAENAVTEAEQLKFRQMGHGKRLYLDVNPVCSAPGQKKNAKGEVEPTKPSTLYLMLCVFLNDGDPLTEEQLGRASEAELKAWTAKYNKAAQAGNIEVMAELSGMSVADMKETPEFVRQPIKDLMTSRMRYSAAVVAGHLARIQAEHPQVYATPLTKTAQDGHKYNKLDGIDALVPEDAQVNGAWPFKKPYDEREADDDTELVCAHCGEHTRGYARRDNNEWVSNIASSETSIEEFGVILCGRCIRKQREADKTAETDELV